MKNQASVRLPWSGQAQAQLAIEGGLAPWLLHAHERSSAAGDEPLFAAEFGGQAPAVTLCDETVRVRYAWTAMFCSKCSQVALNPMVSWTIAVRGGAAHVHADLRGIELRALSIDGGVQDVLLELPPLRDPVPVSILIRGGAAKLTIVRPHEVPLAVEVGGGAARVQLDDMSLGSVGGPLSWRSEGQVGPGYHVHIRGGAARLVVARATPTRAPVREELVRCA